MKKNIFTFLLLLLAGSGLAQVSYGIKGGLNVSSMSVSDPAVSSKNGFHAGVYVKFSALLIAVQPEFLYSQKGYTTSAGSNDVDVRLNYLDIPVMLKVKLFPALSADIGPQYSLLLSQETKITDNNTGNTQKNTGLGGMNKGNLGAGVGMSLQIFKVGIGARYVFDFDDVDKSTKSKNRVFQLSGVLKF